MRQRLSNWLFELAAFFGAIAIYYLAFTNEEAQAGIWVFVSGVLVIVGTLAADHEDEMADLRQMYQPDENKDSL